MNVGSMKSLDLLESQIGLRHTWTCRHGTNSPVVGYKKYM